MKIATPCELGVPVLPAGEVPAIRHFVGCHCRALQPDLANRHRLPACCPKSSGRCPGWEPSTCTPRCFPQYRGAAPINWAIINGERETGVTTFLLNHEIDKGAILAQERVAIAPEDNVGTLYERLMLLGAELVTATVDRIAAGNCTPAEQCDFDESRLHPAPKIFKEDCRIDWRQPAAPICNLIRD